MIDTIFGSKLGMGQTFVGTTRVPITWIKVGPCVVTQIKREEKDGYWAVQLGFGERKVKNVSKPLRGHLKDAIKKLNIAPRFLKEVRLDKEPDFKVGDTISVSDIFKNGDIVQITGISKGKGFAGVVKRWSFSGGPRTHGQSDRERASGSIGQGTTPGRVWKGKKMAGRMGGRKVTLKNLVVVSVDSEKDLMSVSGAVPGARYSLLTIKKLGEGKLSQLEEEIPLPEIQQEESTEDQVRSEEVGTVDRKENV